MTNDLYSIKKLLKECAELGAAEMLKTLQPKSDELTQNQAFKKYGETWVRQCTKNNLISKMRRGVAKNSPLYYSKSELMTVKHAENASRLGVFDNTNL